MRMLLVGLLSTPDQAREIEYITKLFIVGIHTRKLAQKIEDVK